MSTEPEHADEAADKVTDGPAAHVPDPVGPERLRGLSHPLRVKILNLLQTHGAQTASRLAEKVGESSGSTSYHLRQLAKHGFVNEVPGKGTARERWWEAAPGGFSIYPDAADDVATLSAKSMVNAEFERARQENIWRLLRVMDDAGDDPRFEEWSRSVTLSTTNTFATPEQMDRLITAVREVLSEQLAPLKDQEGVPGARPVQIHFNALPILDAD